MNNNQIINQQVSHYDDYLKIKNNPRYKKVWKFLKFNTSKGKLLDIGCTNGDFSEPLVKNGYDCYGLEYVNKAIKESTEKGIKVIKGSFLEKFPFEDEFFDVVFAGEVIEHTIDDKFFLEEIFRVLKKDGLLILTTPNLVSFGNRFLMVLGKMPRFAYNEFHYRFYNKRIVIRKIEDSGFKVVKFSSNYVLISTFFNKFIGYIGELSGSLLPSFGENFIAYARKNNEKINK